MFQFKWQTPAPDSENIVFMVLGVTVGDTYPGKLMAAVSFSARSTLNSTSTRLREVSLG
ncbi:MAG: hypothetical protein IH895_02085 [Planctomycetes bacterium]|nr:hypothetical protein [Planctomycetota bacterium]